MTVTVETNRRCEVIEMRLFDEKASRERPLSGGPPAQPMAGEARAITWRTRWRPFGWRRLRRVQDLGDAVCRTHHPGHGGRWPGGRGGGVSAARLSL